MIWSTRSEANLSLAWRGEVLTWALTLASGVAPLVDHQLEGLAEGDAAVGIGAEVGLLLQVHALHVGVEIALAAEGLVAVARGAAEGLLVEVDGVHVPGQVLVSLIGEAAGGALVGPLLQVGDPVVAPHVALVGEGLAAALGLAWDPDGAVCGLHVTSAP